jgi:uncharacterized protein YciI/heme-degrading monooxygenase HmoA
VPYFAVLYDVVNDFVARRGAYREEHLRRVSESYARGELILGGALAEPTDRALLVFHVADKRVAEAFIESDPYVVNRLVKNWEVHPWNVVTGNEASPNLIVPEHPAEIIRTWSARASNEQWPRYREHFTKKVLPELRGTAGYLGATLSVRGSGEQRGILVETYWRSLDAVQAFAGVDVEAAVVASEAAALLAEHDKHVRHYEIVLSDRAKL